MKYLILFIIIGVAEIFVITSLHEEVGLLNSIYIYLVGTAIGGVLIYKDWGAEVAKFKKTGEMDKEWLQRIYEKPNSFSESDAESFRTLYEPFIFFAAVVCICIPGIVTDVLGIVLAIAPIRRQFVQLLIKKYTRRANA